MSSFQGWRRLFESGMPLQNKEAFSIPAYSEFMPPPRIGKGLGGRSLHSYVFDEEKPFSWHISEWEEETEFRPGLPHIAAQIAKQIHNLGSGRPAYYIAGHADANIRQNPYWPPELAAKTPSLAHEKYVILLPLAFSRTQDDKGRVHWTVFGGSEQSAAQVFWKSFYTAPGVEKPFSDFAVFISRILESVYGENTGTDVSGLLEAGFRIYPEEGLDMPSWTREFLSDSADGEKYAEVKYLLTFSPFSELPEDLRTAYLEGRLNLLPFPGSLLFYGTPSYFKLADELPLAMQIPLLRLLSVNRGVNTLRVPQSGWIHESHPSVDESRVRRELLLDVYQRSHRFNRSGRNSEDTDMLSGGDKILKVLFSTEPDSMGLYDKPMARNAQLWSEHYELILDGPNASKEQIRYAEERLLHGGLFGYRFQFPAMRAGGYEVYWHRPICGFIKEDGSFEKFDHAPNGYFTAYKRILNGIDSSDPVELWPVFMQRPEYLSAIRDFKSIHDHYFMQTPLNILSILDSLELSGSEKIPASFARQLLRIPKHKTLEDWIAALPAHASGPDAGRKMQSVMERSVEPSENIAAEHYITYDYTRQRSFEEAFWNDMKYLSHGDYVSKTNSDCALDPLTLKYAGHRKRDLDALGDYLISRHRKSIEESGMQSRGALCGELPFKWNTDFEFKDFGGWCRNQNNETYERNVLVIIPGRNRNEAVVMADHYDTAYMEDVYEKSRGGSGARLSAAGADDNHSATATLLQAAPIFLRLSAEGKLERDIWLLHLTGEEFPSDCMGARHFCQALIKKELRLRTAESIEHDLSNVNIEGVFVLDMIAHNRDNDMDTFQISPGRCAESLKIAGNAHLSNLLWNNGVKNWNRTPCRRGCERAKRGGGLAVPPPFPHLPLHGELRTQDDPQSSLYNTDGQIFSDAGLPVVLFMENYDLNRSGYHDTKDTMDNIDIDFGAALSAIAIESVARTATL